MFLEKSKYVMWSMCYLMGEKLFNNAYIYHILKSDTWNILQLSQLNLYKVEKRYMDSKWKKEYSTFSHYKNANENHSEISVHLH